MFKRKNYPVSVSFVKDHYEKLPKIFKKVRPHKEVFIGVCLLDGSFMCDSPEELYSSLTLGEKLSVLCYDTEKVEPLEVRRNNGTVLGTLPFNESVFPNMLISRGIDVFCYIEATDFTAGILEIAVSIYCERY